MARARGTAALASTGATTTAATERLRIPTNGPHDAETLDAAFTPPKGTVDFGAVRVPVPGEGTVVVEPASEGRMQAVHVSVPEGRLSVSALAAPRNGGLWPDLAGEIDTSLREGGARVRSFTGEWGRELHATTDGATSVFVGVDGPRWMLYGVATGPTRDAVALDARLRRMLRGTVVVRGKAPYPVRTVLPLTAQSTAEGAEQGAAPPTMTLRAGSTVTNGAVAAQAGDTVNGTSAAGAPILAGLRGPETTGAVPAGAPLAAGTNGHSVAPNGFAPDGATATGTGGVPAASAPANGWSPTGVEATPAWGAPALGAATPYGVPSHGTGTYGAPPVGPPTGAYAFGPGGHGPATNGPATNGPATNGTATNGATPYGAPPVGSAAGTNGYGMPQPGSATNGASVYGVPPAGSATGTTPYGMPQPNPAATGTGTGGVPPVGPPTGANGYSTGGYSTPQPGPAVNGTGTYGVPTYGTGAYGVPPAGSTTGANAYNTGGYQQQPETTANGTGAYGVPPVDSTSHGAAGYGVPQAGPSTGAYRTGDYPQQPDVAANGTGGFGVPPAGASPYGTGSYAQQPRPTSHSAADYGVPPAASGANAYDTGSYGIPQPGQATNGAGTYGAPSQGAATNGASAYNGLSFTPPSGAASTESAPGDGSASGWELGLAPSSTGGHSRPAVPPGWAHESGRQRRRSAAQPPQAADASPSPSEQAWVPWTPEAVDPTAFAASERSSAPAEPPLDWRPSWADPDPRPAEPAASASSESSWRPSWADPEPRPAEPAASASSVSDWRPSWADPEPASPTPSWDPLFGPLAGGLDPLPEPAATWSDVVDRPEPRSAAPARSDDAGTPLFDAAARPAARPAASGRDTPLFDAAAGTGSAAPVSGRRRRDAAPDPAAHLAAPDPAGRVQRHREDTRADRRNAVARDAEPRSGRRRAPEPAVEGRHDAGAVPNRHGADGVPSRHGAEPEARHADPGSAYVAQHGTSHRVPPTQWAWPKDPVAVSAEPEASTGRRAADTGPASWSAADLVDSPGYGGRRRRSENGRHGEPDDVEPGRHHRP